MHLTVCSFHVTYAFQSESALTWQEHTRTYKIVTWQERTVKKSLVSILKSLLFVLTKFSFWEEDWSLGYNPIKFYIFFDTSSSPKILNFIPFDKLRGNSYRTCLLLIITQQTYQRWYLVENESWADVHLSTLFQSWQNNVETTLMQLRRFNVDDPILFQRWNLNENESWVYVCLSTLFQRLQNNVETTLTE